MCDGVQMAIKCGSHKALGPKKRPRTCRGLYYAVGGVADHRTLLLRRNRSWGRISWCWRHCWRSSWGRSGRWCFGHWCGVSHWGWCRSAGFNRWRRVGRWRRRARIGREYEITDSQQGQHNDDADKPAGAAALARVNGTVLVVGIDSIAVRGSHDVAPCFTYDKETRGFGFCSQWRDLWAP